MKRWTYYFLLLLLAIACSTQPVQEVPAPKTVDVILKPIEVKPEANRPRKTFDFKLHPIKPDQDLAVYKRAIALIKLHANTDAFYAHMRTKRTYFAHAPCKVDDCLKTWREQMDKGETIDVLFYTPYWKSDVIGGWNGKTINENTKKSYLTDVQRAGHLLHEASHKYLWTHKGNYTYRHDNINSFPYAVGEDLAEYITLKTNQLAGE